MSQIPIGSNQETDPVTPSNSQLPDYSVLISIYAGDKPDQVRVALESMLNQTHRPTQIVAVWDGPVAQQIRPLLKDLAYASGLQFTVVSYPHNRGLGFALARGLEHCHFDLVARMDADDLSHPDRVEKQLRFLLAEDLDLVGCQVNEFMDSLDQVLARTHYPLSHADIVAFSKRRTPFRHPTILFKKHRALAAGNYRGKFLFFEDWDLFNRMLSVGARCGNMPDCLLDARVDPDFYGRRGGLTYARHIWRFKFAQLKSGYFTWRDFLSSATPHLAVCLLPNRIRAAIYQRFLRKSMT